MKAISKIEPKSTIENNYTKSVFVEWGYEHIKLNTVDILHIKADSDYTEITTPDKKILSKESLKHWAEKLEESNFCQIHKSYIINIQHLQKVTGSQAYLNDTLLPIGRAYKKSFMDKMS